MLLVNILEKNEKSKDPIDHQPTHQPTHPDNKGFRGFKKGRSSHVFLKVQFWFQSHIIKWKDCQVDPIGTASLFPSGDKA